MTNYNGPNALSGAIDVNAISGTTVFLSSQFYSTFDVTQCSALCNSYTASSKKKAVSAKSSTYTPCNYFNVFNVSANGQYAGMYCQLYTTSAVSSYDDLTYEVQNNVVYNASYSYGYALYPQDSGSTKVTWSAAPTGTAAACSALGTVGTVITDYNQVNYTIACGYDVQYSNDIGNTTAPDFYSCFNLCDNFDNCDGFAYLGDVCYFKNLAGTSRTPQVDTYGTDFAWQNDGSYAGFSASTVAATVSYTTKTTAWTGTATTTVTQLNGLSGTVLVETPGAVASTTGTVYVTVAYDTGTASTIGTTTVTPTSGSTYTVKVNYPTPPTTCSNTGIAYAAYSNKWPGGQNTASYPKFTPEAYKTVSPSFKGSATYLAETNPTSGAVSIYGRSTSDATSLVLDHVFYLFAGRGTGYYSFVIPYADDVTFVWIGSDALSGWTRSNADLTQFWSSSGQSSKTLAFYLNQGTYTPVRVMWGNGGGQGDLRFNVLAPDGTTLMSSTAGANAGYLSPDIVQFPCNTALGAKFAAWGSEK